jgi:HupE / UreJ protein
MVRGATWVCVLSWIGATLAWIASASSSYAHEIRPAVVTVSIATADRFDVTVALNLEALMAGVGPEHQDTNDAPQAHTYNALRALAPDALRQKFTDGAAKWLEGVTLEFDGQRAAPRIEAIDIPPDGNPRLARISTIKLAGAKPAEAKSLRWGYAAAYGASIVRLKRNGEAPTEIGWVNGGQLSQPARIDTAEAKSQLARFLDYIAVGFTHIVPKGLDHILFVLGLYLLGSDWRPLLIQVTAFTLAHSLTLALGLFGVVEVPAAIVEPLIALSIVYVAVENMATSKLQVWRPAVVFAFGLLHGLGFAGVLHEIGMPRTDYAIGLVGFNVGVELGQLTVIAAAWLATGLWFRDQPWYRARIAVPASAVIALVGAYWCVERIWYS